MALPVDVSGHDIPLWRTFLIFLSSDIQEIFGSHFELPELGALGGNGLANRRDFETPVACFEVDQSPWEIVYKCVPSFSLSDMPIVMMYRVCGQLHACHQDHTPFDVVAWHGKYVSLFVLDWVCDSYILSYVPYKYAMEKFIFVGSISRDHIDPSCFCVLTAKSKHDNAPLVDFLILAERWDVATNTFRPPVSGRHFHDHDANF
jgi:homogentisate 1,2-dioxygenase